MEDGGDVRRLGSIMPPKLILTGFMATGKTTIARAVAERLCWRLIDSDERLVARAGKPIQQIFRDHGEAHFRALERDVIAAIAADRERCPQSGMPRPAVVATGGGTLIDPVNFATLERVGVIVCLVARPDVIARRIGRHAASRPMLTEGGKPLRVRIAELLEERRVAYARAPISIDTSQASVGKVTEMVLEAFAKYGSVQWKASA
ncbi:MAG TPA: shikimate kinase [Candidatus Binataceae bacterium]|nr:shikimate kinase [Candidatus Binataceae bacterium]